MAVTQETTRYLESFERLDQRAATSGQAWLQPIRRAAIARFTELGFPTTKDEDWRFTSVAPIARTVFAEPGDGQADPALSALEPFAFSGLEGSRLVFVNGRYSTALSSVGALPPGVKVGSLAQALTAEPAL
ncbi:MAG TPA: Fe-S cluster assembly protein SufD, partial [Candidatus Methylomirabilis sp.]|nr:Fe-S cluster assembly protein SufD [Candidatus Methylomirabilis sp.]